MRLAIISIFSKFVCARCVYIYMHSPMCVDPPVCVDACPCYVQPFPWSWSTLFIAAGSPSQAQSSPVPSLTPGHTLCHTSTHTLGHTPGHTLCHTSTHTPGYTPAVFSRALSLSLFWELGFQTECHSTLSGFHLGSRAGNAGPHSCILST